MAKDGKLLNVRESKRVFYLRMVAKYGDDLSGLIV